jgi:hypothetical protein
VRDTSYKDARSVVHKTGTIMNRRTLQILALTILLPAMICGSIARAQEMFKLLGENEIRARVIGKDMTDNTHWANYFRPDGVLLSEEGGSEVVRDMEDPKQQTLHVEPKSGIANLQ